MCKTSKNGICPLKCNDKCCLAFEEDEDETTKKVRELLRKKYGLKGEFKPYV